MIFNAKHFSIVDNCFVAEASCLRTKTPPKNFAIEHNGTQLEFVFSSNDINHGEVTGWNYKEKSSDKTALIIND